MKNTRIKYWLALLITEIYLIIVFKFFNIIYEDLQALTPNEVGDFLAGTFAPLGFLFLILGYLLQSETLKISLEENNRLLKIQEKEINSKHFSVLPYFEQPNAFFDIIKEDVYMYDANDNFDGIKEVQLGKLKFTFKNTGEVAKHFEMVDEKTKLVECSAVEIIKGNSLEATITLEPYEIDILHKKRSHKNTFSIKYFDQYGKEFNQRIECTLMHDIEEGDYWPSLKIFN